MPSSLLTRINYGQQYFESEASLLKSILEKTVVPYQVEVQPGRIGGAICWLQCPYCYGGSSENVKDRLKPERYVELMKQMVNGPHGRINKIIYGGYATDPLNYQHIDDLVQVSIDERQVVGFHTKLVKISDRLVDLVTHADLAQTSYMTVSVDAGSSAAYNAVHGLSPTVKVYPKVIENLRRLISARAVRQAPLDITANYLVTRANCETEDVRTGVQTLLDIGVDVVRFSFPQLPRGQEDHAGMELIPNPVEWREITDRLRPMLEDFGEGVMFTIDPAQNATGRRTLPCFARFIYPAISYDGYLSNCSQSAAPHFSNMALGNLADVDFWDAFYDYDASNLRAVMEAQHKKMNANDCRCDRKEHRVNGQLRSAFDSLPL